MSQRFPDFIIIGAMKCATSTLHAQLAAQAGVFMCTPKEPSFFSQDPVFERGSEWYASLFSAAPIDALCGEASTDCTKLPEYPETAARIRSLLPEVRLIYVMRHPMERLVSHYIHEWTMNVTREPLGAALESHPELVQFGLYAHQLEPYLRLFPRTQIFPVFLEALHARPQDELERVCRFLDYPGTPRWIESDAKRNDSLSRVRLTPMRRALLETGWLRRSARRLVPYGMRQSLLERWTIGARPALQPEQEQRLSETFDADLRRLGSWLGLDLSCRTFRAVASSGRPEWTEEAPELGREAAIDRQLGLRETDPNDWSQKERGDRPPHS